jgi:decaprenyl-phosphate phosphoribosyltransferase
MASLNDYRRLLRVEQWYKNLILLLPFIFVESARGGWGLLAAILGFCCVSSITYMINDWVDRRVDRLHPTKKFRPLASGAISGRQAEIVSFVLALIILVIGWQLGSFYWWPIGIYFVATNLYSFGLKKVPFLDIAMIAGNFVLRMLGGMSTWPQLEEWGLFVFVFTLMLMFLSHKRRSDIKLLGKKKAIKHKPVLLYYRRPVVYILRGMTYLVLLFLLWEMGVIILNLVAVFLILLVTSNEFVKEPKLVLKPHHLVMRPQWILAVTAGLAIILLF